MDAAAIAIIIGAAGSVAFLFHATGQGAGAVLRLVMTAWVVAPFAALELGRRFSARSRPALAWGIAAVSLALYDANALRPFSPKAAFAFVMVPMGAWAALAAAGLGAWLASRKR